MTNLNTALTKPYKVKSCLGKILEFNGLISDLQKDLQYSELIGKYATGESVYLDCQDSLEKPYHVLHNLFEGFLACIESKLKKGSLGANLGDGKCAIGKPCDVKVDDIIIEDCDCKKSGGNISKKHYNSESTCCALDPGFECECVEEVDHKEEILKILAENNIELDKLRLCDLCECCQKYLCKDCDWSTICNCESDYSLSSDDENEKGAPLRNESTMYNIDDLKSRNKRIADRNVTAADIQNIFEDACSSDRKAYKKTMRRFLRDLVPDCDCKIHCDYKEAHKIKELDGKTPSFEHFLRKLMLKLAPIDECDTCCDATYCKICAFCPIDKVP